MNINECGYRPYGWLGLDGDRCIRVIPRHSGSCSELDATGDNPDKTHHGHLILALATKKCNFYCPQM